MSIEAMKQALEALEGLVDLAHEAGFPCDRAEATITSLRQAIEQAEKQKPFAYLDPGLGAFYWAREYPDGPPPGFEPVYLAGSNKRWVGLTQGDERECLAAGVDNGWRGVMEATEAKLKEKNT